MAFDPLFDVLKSDAARSPVRQLPLARADSGVPHPDLQRFLSESWGAHGDAGSGERLIAASACESRQDRDLAAEFAERQQLKIEFVSVEFKELIAKLTAGAGDVIVAGMTVTDARKEKVAFTQPVATVQQIIVGKAGALNFPSKPAELAGKSVHVHPGSAYEETLVALQKTTAPGLVIVPAPENIDSEQLAYEVGRGSRPPASRAPAAPRPAPG